MSRELTVTHPRPGRGEEGMMAKYEPCARCDRNNVPTGKWTSAPYVGMFLCTRCKISISFDEAEKKRKPRPVDGQGRDGDRRG